MEKTKNIPGWYQRLISHHTKPPSQITFKQYCHEHETKMKVLYPFLPQEQVKGKLFARWKRFQPQNLSTCIKGGTKKLNKPNKFPVVAFSKSADQKAALRKDSENQFDWLIETGLSTNSGKSEKTYKGRAFVITPKVPDIISETPNPERSILKNRSTEASSARLKRQPASQVSFTLNDEECQSPAPYSPPTPFVLSPMSDEDRSINVLSRKDSLKSSPSKSSLNLETEKKISTATLRNATDNRTVAEEHPVQKTTKRRTNIDGSPKAISKWKPVRKREKKERKTPQRHCNRSTDTEDTQPSSQLLEPPKFSTAPSETTDKDRRFCLFEDEWIKPKSPAKKKKDRQRKSKSPKEESNKEPIFSWSPALGCSQYTPKVKKATEGLFPAENEAYHYRVDRQRQSNVSAKQRDLSEKYHEKKCKKQKRSSGIKNMCQVMTGSSCPKRKENGLRRAKCPVPEKTQKRQVDSHKARSERISFLELPSADIHECEDYENQTKHSSLPQTKTFKMKQRSIHRTEDDENRRELRQRKSLRSESNPIFDEPKTTASASANAEDRSGGVSENRPRMSKRKNKMDKLDKQSPICTENSLVPDGEAKYVRPVREKQVSHEKPEIDISASPPSDFSPIKRKSFTGDYTPSHSQGADLLRRILFQLKNTVTSSQSAAQVSPTQSRITEVSGMSVKSLSSNGPSPSSLRDVRDLMDDLEPLEEAPKKKTLTTVNSGTAYRKRGNILCNMFDEFDSENGPPAKTKRFLPSQSRLTESDFDILFSADIFV